MTDLFCDILPADNGWIFVVGGYQSASYPSYEMAVKAASEHSDGINTERARVVLRRQNLQGDMTKVHTTLSALSHVQRETRIG